MLKLMKTKLKEAKLFAGADPAGKSQKDLKLSSLNLLKAPGDDVKEQVVPVCGSAREFSGERSGYCSC